MTLETPLDRRSAEAIIESLRKGIPPSRHVSQYAADTDFVESVRRRHLARGIESGKIRFVSGSWGAGKTHFFRLLREYAFDSGLLVSTVELNAEQTPFNKFERVFYEIVRNVTSPTMYLEDNLKSAQPFGAVLAESVHRRSGVTGDPVSAVAQLRDELMAEAAIDIDFKRVIIAYWDTFTAQVDDDSSLLEDRRATLLQWFEGEGHAVSLRKEYGIQKMITKENARLALTSLGRFAKFLGFGGLLILFDESEMTTSTMRKSNLKQAHNNLLHLINEIDASEGLFLIYAAVPDFFLDAKFGIPQYGALAARIGAPSGTAPRPLEQVWDLDASQHGADAYQEAATKIRGIFLVAYSEDSDEVLSEEELRDHVGGLISEHPEYSPVGLWRVVIKGTVEVLTTSLDGDPVPTPSVAHARIVDLLRED